MKRPAAAALVAAVTALGMSLAPRAWPAEAPATVPLRVGLTIVTAIHDERGDFESIKTVTRLESEWVRILYNADLPPPKAGSLAALLGLRCSTDEKIVSGKPIPRSRVRDVRRADLEDAHDYRFIFDICGSGSEIYEDSTALGLSSEGLRELRTAGTTFLNIPIVKESTALVSGLVTGLAGGQLAATQASQSGDLTRVEKTDVAFRVIVNDEPRELPAIHARGSFDADQVDFWILDDPANPIALHWKVGPSELQVIKIKYPLTNPAEDRAAPAAPLPAAGSGKIARDLAANGRTDVYGIYFDFGSDRIKDESEPVLREIAGVMRSNPTWTLTVEGHTDNIGGTAANLDLSKRRAAAVKQALVSRYQVAEARLKTDGFGESRPKTTNATLDGRALNRRVELARSQ